MERIIRIRNRRLLFTMLSATLHAAFTAYMLMLGIGDVATTGICGIATLIVHAAAISVPVVLVLGLVPKVEKFFFPLANILASMAMTIYIIPIAVGCHC
ncbi:MAG: hypothetical protein IJR99_15390 [Kiritimatiellae bacterium]|nr:hypothetical protein [Kiritimatiellia bacterium]